MNFADTPLAPSAYGRRLYQLGRQLVDRHGLRPAQLVWDADEVLWDWVIEASVLVTRGYRYLLSGDLAHVEHLRIRPGILELIWGMYHAAAERDIDPYLRIWTNGYPWRMWRISQEVPGFATLLGSPATADAPDAWTDHPRLFTRVDYARAAMTLLQPGHRDDLVARVDPRAADVFSRHWRDRPWDSNLKLPELAPVVAKPGFDDAAILIDDRRQNVQRFVDSGRQGVLISYPAVAGGVLHLNFSRQPDRYLSRGTTHIAEHIAEALRRLAEGGPKLCCAMSSEPLADYPVRQFSLAIPNEVLQSEWVGPKRRVRRAISRRRWPLLA